MTGIKRINLTILGLLLGLATVLGMAMLGYSTARGDGSAVIDAGGGPDVGSGSTVAPAPLPHDTLKDPIADPQGAVSDIEMAKKKGGWLGAILVGLYVACRLLGKLGEKVTWLAFFNKGRAAMLIAAIGTILASCVDSVLLGGTYVTVLIAGLWAIVGLLGTKPTEKKA